MRTHCVSASTYLDQIHHLTSEYGIWLFNTMGKSCWYVRSTPLWNAWSRWCLGEVVKGDTWRTTTWCELVGPLQSILYEAIVGISDYSNFWLAYYFSFFYKGTSSPWSYSWSWWCSSTTSSSPKPWSCAWLRWIIRFSSRYHPFGKLWPGQQPGAKSAETCLWETISSGDGPVPGFRAYGGIAPGSSKAVGQRGANERCHQNCLWCCFWKSTVMSKILSISLHERCRGGQCALYKCLPISIFLRKFVKSWH